MIDILPKYSPTGKKKRLSFKNKVDAAEESSRLIRQKKTAEAGIPILSSSDTARIHALLAKVGGNIDNLETLALNTPLKVTKTVEEAVTSFLAEKKFKKVSNSQYKNLKSKLSHFRKAFKARPIHSISVDEFSTWFQELKGQDHAGKARELTDTTKGNIHRAISQFVDFCVQREWITKNFMKSVVKPRSNDPKKGVLTPEQIQAMIDAAEGEELAIIALGAYAGLRTAEICGNEDHGGMKWEWIDFERGEILVPKEVTKKRKERIVPMNDAFREIIKKAGIKKTGPVVSLSDRRTRAMREKFTKAAKLKVWIDNCFRHSFASYYLALNENAATLSLWIGHKDADTTHRFYARLVRKDMAKEYDAVRPKIDSK